MTSINLYSNDKTKVPYRKIETIRDLCYIYDSVKPRHCKEIKSCSYDPLILSSSATTNRTIIVDFPGWEDPTPVGGANFLASGIESYHITLHHVKNSGNNLLMNPASISSSLNGTKSVVLQLPEQDPALYAIVLEVKDVANNVRQARSFFLYDNSSRILHRNDKRLYAYTTSNETLNEWQTHHENPCVSWKERYYNNNFAYFNSLTKILPELQGHITGIYEQISGVLPLTGTNNVNGITEFKYEVFKIMKPYTLMSVSSSQSLPNVQDQQICLPVTPEDGDNYFFFLNVRDVVGHAYNEYFNFHIDASPPTITNIEMVRDQHSQMDSSTKELSYLQFDAYDEHSGLLNVLWELHKKDPAVKLANGAVSVIRILENVNTTLILI